MKERTLFKNSVHLFNEFRVITLNPMKSLGRRDWVDEVRVSNGMFVQIHVINGLLKFYQVLERFRIGKYCI